jgi:hypothetical protein
VGNHHGAMEDDNVDALLDEIDGLLLDSAAPEPRSIPKAVPSAPPPRTAIPERTIAASSSSIGRPGGDGDDIDRLIADVCASSPPKPASSYSGAGANGAPARNSGERSITPQVSATQAFGACEWWRRGGRDGHAVRLQRTPRRALNALVCRSYRDHAELSTKHIR